MTLLPLPSASLQEDIRCQPAHVPPRHRVLWLPGWRAALPIILILSWGVIGIELLVWKFLLRTQSTEWSWEAELGRTFARRVLAGLAGMSWMAVWPTGGCFRPETLPAVSGAGGRGEHCHFLHYLVNMWAACFGLTPKAEHQHLLVLLAPVGTLA